MDSALRILVVRPDRLGDVILSTPVLEVIRQYYPHAHVTLMVRHYAEPLVSGLPTVNHIFVYEPEKKHAGWSGFFKLLQEIKEQQFRIAVVLYSSWKIDLALFLARVLYRIGPLSKWHSFLFYNRGMRQRRSHVEMHEVDYNLRLLSQLGIEVSSKDVLTQVYLSPDVKTAAMNWLVEQGWKPTHGLVLIHPGMGGSALNWPEVYYHEVVRILIQEGRQVLVTGGPEEELLHTRFKQALGEMHQQVIFYRSAKLASTDFLGGLCLCADVIVAPSTGPLHLAVALKKPVVTFYPPVRVQSVLRWGPYVFDEEQATILVPEVYCGQDFRCLGEVCHYFPCMKSIGVRRVTEAIDRHLMRLQQLSTTAHD